jgi:hypothetical protein
MAMDFPSLPSVGQKYPPAPTPGVPTYVWDGEKWKGAGGNSVKGKPSNVPPTMDGLTAPGFSPDYARGDHQHPSDSTRAPIDSPAFIGSLAADEFNVYGNINFNGAINATENSHVLGYAGGNSYNTALRRSDSNALMYDLGEANWAGIGTDSNGQFWVHTGYDVTYSLSAGLAVLTDQTVSFAVPPLAPTAPPGDDSTKLATTEFVVANQVGGGGGPYLPLDGGGTMTGVLTVAPGAHIMPYRNGSTGVLYLSWDDHYLYFDGGSYYLNALLLNTAAGRIWGSSDFSNPVSSAQIGPHAGDFWIGGTTGLQEPYGGAVITGATNVYRNGTSGVSWRFRYKQVYTGWWWTIGYA